MRPFQNIDEELDIMKRCFPKGNNFQIEEKSVVEGYQHYVGDIIRLTLKYEEDGKQNEKQLILKVPKDNAAAAVFSKLDFIAREPFVYNHVIPYINDYLDESPAPIYYTAIDSKIIILGNLVEQGYEKGEKGRRSYTLDQCYPILKALANFHATTHKLCQKNADLLEHKMFHYSPALEFRQCMADYFEPILIELLTRNDASSSIPNLKKANFYLRKKDDDVASRLHYSNFDFYVLNHGDFQRGNILLKYGSNDQVEGVKILDYQTCFWSSPAYDFMYFLMISTDVETIDKHFDTLLDWYLKCLNERLSKVNSSRRYQKEDFMDDIKKLCLCLLFFIPFNSLMLCPLDQNELLDKMCLGQKDDIQVYMDACLNDQLYTSTMLSCFRLCNKLGLFEHMSD